MLTEKQVVAYLDRIGLGGLGSAPECTRALLDDLIFAHLTSVPFSTVDIKDPASAPDLGIDALFQKIVVDRHGGYCFELNKLFEALLATLGFDAYPCLCRSVRGRDPMPVNHRGEIVLVEGLFCYADVGFGGPLCSRAVPLADGKPIFDGMYTFVPEQAEGDSWWRLDRLTGGESDIFGDAGEVRRQTELLICDERAAEADFDALNEQLSKPGVLFFDHDIVNLRTVNGYMALKDFAFTMRTCAGKQTIELAGEVGRADFLDRMMGFRPYGS